MPNKMNKLTEIVIYLEVFFCFQNNSRLRCKPVYSNTITACKLAYFHHYTE